MREGWRGEVCVTSEKGCGRRRFSAQEVCAGQDVILH